MKHLCPICGRYAAVKKNGQLVAHGYGKVLKDKGLMEWRPRCKGSYGYPMPEPKENKE